MSKDVANNAILEARFRVTYFEQQMMTVLHYSLSNATGTLDGDQIATNLDTAWNVAGNMLPAFVACLCNNAILVSVQYQWVYPTRYAMLEISETLQGTGGADGNPTAVSFFLKKSTDIAGRRQRGGVHMPAVPTDFTSDGQITPAGSSAYDALGTKLHTSYALASPTCTLTPVIYHRTDPTSSPRVLYVTTPQYPGTERRRLVGRGI